MSQDRRSAPPGRAIGARGGQVQIWSTDPRTDHYNKSQHFSDKFDNYKAPDDAASEHKHQPDHRNSLDNNKQQQDTNGYYSKSAHQHNEQYNSISDDDPGSAAEYSKDGSEELDNYTKADKSVNIHADSSISWNTTLAPKIFVNCDIQHAYMVATNPAGSLEESSSCSASMKKLEDKTQEEG